MSDKVEGGSHYDSGKNMLQLVPPELIYAVGEILTYGATKYSAQNWRGGINYSRVVGSLLRHLMAYLSGQKIDPESGKPHLYHAATNLAFLITFEAHPDKYKELDDLYRYEDINEEQKEDKGKEVPTK